jgi:hypothetical protein
MVKLNMSPCVTKHRAMKTCEGVEVQLHAFITSELDGDDCYALRCDRFTSWGKSHRYPLDRRLDGFHNWSGRDGLEKKSLPHPCRELNPGPPVHILVTTLNELLQIIIAYK